MRALVLTAIAATFATACAPPNPTPDRPDGGPWSMPVLPACDRGYTDVPEDRGALGYPELTEISGIVASPRAAGVLWAHNDSGNAAELFALGTDGRPLARVALPVEMLDAEDIAAAPCPDDDSVPCLWIADTGNVARDAADQAIVIVREPDVRPTDSELELTVDETLRVPVTFPDAIDSEALVVLPDASALLLVEKVDASPARIYRLEAPFDEDGGELREVGSFNSPGVGVPLGLMITGADLHPTGAQMVLRLYTGSWEYRFAAGQGPADLGDIAPVIVTLGPLSEPQGEAIAYDDEGWGLWTASEDPDGNPGQMLHHYDCF